MVDATTQIGTEAETQPEGQADNPPQEVIAPDPTVVMQAQVEDLRARNDMLSRQLGERDKGLARLSERIEKETRRQRQALDHIARTTFGVEPAEKTPYDQFREMVAEPDTEKTPPPPLANALAQDAVFDAFTAAGLNPFDLPQEMIPDGNLIAHYISKGDEGKALAVTQKAINEHQKRLQHPTENKPAKPGVNIPIDRSQSRGGTNRRSFAGNEIAAMSDEEYAANKPAIEAAQREGRITR